MKFKILISAPYMQPVVEEYRSIFQQQGAEIIVPTVKERLSEEDLLDLVGEIDGVIAGDDQFSEKVLLKAYPRLKVISKWGTGIDAFDLDACKRLGITVCNTPGAFTDPVADSVLGYILNFSRRLPWMDSQIKKELWDKLPGQALNESILGVIGVGRIGKAVVRRAKAFGMKIYGNDIQEMPKKFIKETKIHMVSFQELLSVSDFISINCDLNKTSRHLINSITLKLMKKNSVLINLARGPIIDESALINALKNNTIAGAALDVFENEPLPESSPLKNFNNVMLAPHNSNSSPTAWRRVHENSIKNLFNVLRKEIK